MSGEHAVASRRINGARWTVMSPRAACHLVELLPIGFAPCGHTISQCALPMPLGCTTRPEGSPKTVSVPGCRTPRQCQIIHIPERFLGEAFSLPVVSNTLPGHLFRGVFPGPAVSKLGTGHRSAFSCREEFAEASGNTKKEYAGIRADLPLGFSRREGKGPPGEPGSLSCELPGYQRLPRSPRSPRSPPRPPP